MWVVGVVSCGVCGVFACWFFVEGVVGAVSVVSRVWRVLSIGFRVYCGGRVRVLEVPFVGGCVVY